MNKHWALRKYQRAKIITSNPLELMLFFLENTQKEIVKSRRSLNKNKIVEKNKYLNRGQLYISEMILLLDKSTNSYEQYKVFLEYIINRLIYANTNNDLSVLEEVEGYINVLILEWKNIKKK